MLTHLHIRDFAIIDNLELELQAGMTALTGETGAGKSILLDAIGLVLGDKADSGSVRHGADKAEITLSVDIHAVPDAQAWLTEQDLAHEEENCILRRVITSQGKSRAWINGSPVTLTLLRELGELMVDIHGQHEHQSLMKKDMQLQLLDEFAGDSSLLDNTRAAWREWKTLNDRLQIITSQSQQYQERLDLLNFQVQELEQLAVADNEFTELDEELTRLAYADQLKATAEQSHHVLYEDEPSLYSQLSYLMQELSREVQHDEALAAPLELITSAQIQVQEAAYLLRDYAEGLENDPKRLQWVEQRLDAIRSTARKYRLEPEQLPQHLAKLQAELKALDSDDYDLEALQGKLSKAAEQYQKTAQKLSKHRRQAADHLSTQVTQAMQQLGMQGGRFEASLVPYAAQEVHPHGLEQIEFLVSANPGQPLKPLIKVASGGELSRISLAIQMIAAQKLTLPALIFDEVDTGIGGGIAEVVGSQLRQLGKTRQVLCVTHLPQVAAQAHHHYKITKRKSKTTTSTGVEPLVATARVEEIARMMGGVDITPATRALAQEMVNRTN